MKTISKVQLSSGQSGATFSVADEGNGPMVQIETAGNPSVRLQLLADREALAALGEMFASAAKHEGYSAADEKVAGAVPAGMEGLGFLAHLAQALSGVGGKIRAPRGGSPVPEPADTQAETPMAEIPPPLAAPVSAGA